MSKNTIILAYYLGRKSDNKKADLFDQLICWVTNSRFSHVEIIPSYDMHAPKNHSWSASPKDNGIRKASIDFHTGNWELYEVETEVSRDHIESWFVTQDGAKYDWFGAVGARISFITGSSKRMFCSEAVGQCLNIPNSWTLTPQELFDHSNIKIRRKIEISTRQSQVTDASY